MLVVTDAAQRPRNRDDHERQLSGSARGDVSLGEVDMLLDAEATGVPELAPDRTQQCEITGLEDRITETGGEEQLVLKGRLAYALAPVDLARAKALQAQVWAAPDPAGSPACNHRGRR